MNVNVFVTRVDGQLLNELLVLPFSAQSALPKEYRSGWTYYVTADTGDPIFGEVDAVTLEAEIASLGFAVVKPKVEDRR